MVWAPPLLDELIAKLSLPRIRLKYRIEPEQIEALLALIALRGISVLPSRRVTICRDPADDVFIDVALSGGAGFVVTGDDDLLVLKTYQSVRLATPRVFPGEIDHE